MPDDAIEREHWSRQSIAGIVIQAIVASRSGKGMALPAGRAADEILTLLAPAFASQQAPAAGPLPEKRGLEELTLLYNHADDDSRQFTRWQMLAAINHGIRLSAMLDAAPSVTLGEVG